MIRPLVGPDPTPVAALGRRPTRGATVGLACRRGRKHRASRCRSNGWWRWRCSPAWGCCGTRSARARRISGAAERRPAAVMPGRGRKGMQRTGTAAAIEHRSPACLARRCIRHTRPVLFMSRVIRLGGARRARCAGRASFRLRSIHAGCTRRLRGVAGGPPGPALRAGRTRRSAPDGFAAFHRRKVRAATRGCAWNTVHVRCG